MKKREFKRCPHCRCSQIEEIKIILGARGWFIECKACHWCGPTKRTRRGARKAWNKQAMRTRAEKLADCACLPVW